MCTYAKTPLRSTTTTTKGTHVTISLFQEQSMHTVHRRVISIQMMKVLFATK